MRAGWVPAATLFERTGDHAIGPITDNSSVLTHTTTVGIQTLKPVMNQVNQVNQVQPLPPPRSACRQTGSAKTQAAKYKERHTEEVIDRPILPPKETENTAEV